MDEGLKRVLGGPALAATVVNNTIGAGIFALPAIVGLQMGAAGILGYIVCGIILFTIMLCYTEIGSYITTSGGSFAYVEAAFGNFAGFVISSLFSLGWGIVGDAAVLNILADTMSVLFPVFASPLMRVLLFFMLIGILLLINVRGAKQGVEFVVFITIIKIIPLLFIIFFGFAFVKAGNLHWENMPPLKTFGDTALVLFFAFAGFETSLNSSGEIKNPKRTVPLGILLGGASVLILYILIQVVAQGVLGVQLIQFKDAPLAAVAEKIIGPVGGTLLLVGTIISCLGGISGDFFGFAPVIICGC